VLSRLIRRLVLLLALATLAFAVVFSLATRSASAPIDPPTTIAVPPAYQYAPVPAGPPDPSGKG
jgi:hypothetical protein